MAWNTDLDGPALAFAGSSASRLRALAGPGAGKTFALLRRVARLLEEGHQPSELLIVTFARTAAEDLRRALRALGDEVDVTARTLHSFCFSILSREGVLQITERVPRLLLEFERDHLICDLDGSFGGLKDRRHLVRAFEAAWARLQSEEPGHPVAGLDQAFQDALLACLRWYGAMLIGEVVPLTLSYLRHNPQAEEFDEFSHVLVDEYQDLNKAEQGIIDLLAERADLTVIGDDDQSIYGFKWANPEAIRTFPVSHPGTEDVEFIECRRCPKRVVRLAQCLIERNAGRVKSALKARDSNPEGNLRHVQWTSIAEEAEGLAAFIKHAVDQGVDPGQCLILANSREVGYAIRDAVAARGVDIRSFFREEALDSELAQQRLTLLTLAAVPDDRVALRCWLAFDSTTRRDGPYRRLLQEARRRGTSVADVLRALDSGGLAIPHTNGCVERWRDLQRRLAEIQDASSELRRVVDLLFPEGDSSDDDLRALRETALACLPESGSLDELHRHVRYGIAQPEVPLETPYARVMSFHKSKGLTARLVVLAGLVEGLMPRVSADAVGDERQHAIEEQRRLFFVGMTRTQETLVFSSYSELDDRTVHRLQVRRGARRGRAFRVVASGFLAELGPELPRAIRGQDWSY